MTGREIEYFIKTDSAPKLKLAPGVEIAILTGLRRERMMMILSTTLPDHTGPMHSHPHEQIGMVYAGKGVVRIGDEERTLKRGDFFNVPPNTPHSDTCLGEEPFVMVEIFCPIREDFIEKMKKVSVSE